MRVVFERCCGLDVHKDTIVACLMIGPAAGPVSTEVRTFGAVTSELLRLRDWLEQEGATHVAMESTGVYWKPVFNILEGGPEVWLINAQHLTRLPGRKTDVKDSEWLADLLRHGLVKPSFVPPMDTRDLRDLTRYRTRLIGDRTSEVNRVQKVLEGANVKLGSVASDVLGVSGRAMLDAIVAGERDAEKLASLARGRLKGKKDELILALEGMVRSHHRFMLRQHLAHIDHLNGLIDELSREIEERLRPFLEVVKWFDEVPGIGQRLAENLLAEIGTNMNQFPSSAHLASWAGICPGNNESAGKRFSGKTRKGSPWLRSALVEGAWAAATKQGTYFRARYLRIKARRGPKKAIVAVAHSLLVVLYEMLRNRVAYRELGAAHFDRLTHDTTRRRLIKRLEALGYQVTLEKKAEVA
jgi:transposase